MKKIALKVLVLAAVFCSVLALSGCLSFSAEELYSLPRASEDYRQLQSLIDEEVSSGAVYSPPTSGSNRRSVQLRDLDGDGVDEAISFLSVQEDEPLRVAIYKEQEGDYKRAAVISGQGTSFDCVSYLDMDGDGTMEIAVGWQISSGIKTLQVFSIKGMEPMALYSTNYSEYTLTDMDKDGKSEILVFRMNGLTDTSEAELEMLMPGGEMASLNAKLSVGAENLLHIVSGSLSDGASATYVDCSIGGECVTDIISLSNGKLVNVSMDDRTGTSSGTVRQYSMYCSDINGDGVVEVPMPELLPAQKETTYRCINWCVFSRDGNMRISTTTYHNNQDGWYLTWPGDWRGNVTVRRQDYYTGERTVIFSRVTDNKDDSEETVLQDFLQITMFSGDNREARLSSRGYERLLNEGNRVFGYKILIEDKGFPLSLSSEIVHNGFSIIYSDWLTGLE